MLGTLSVWTFVTGEPRRLGRLQYDGSKTLFEYDREATDLPGIGIAYDPRRLVGHLIPWTSDVEAEPLHPIFMSLVPPCDATNLQYRIAARALGFDRGTLHKEWRMLPLLGHGSIGHLDVFRDDDHAVDWYGRPHGPTVDVIESELVALALDALEASDGLSLERVIEVVGRAPSPGGAMPKIMQEIVWPGSGEAVQAIVKFERADGRRPDLLIAEDWVSNRIQS